MRGSAKSLRVAIAVGATAALLTGAGADAALVKVGKLVLRADGGFNPRVLPKKRFAPIVFQGQASITMNGGGTPPAAQRIVIDIDRDGRLSTRGLPACPAERVAEATVRQARQLCSGAIVGKGLLAAQIGLPDQSRITGTSALTVFNGPRLEGDATVVLHARMTEPEAQTYAISVPVERRGGRFAYRATIDVPPIAGGAGAITYIQAKVGKSYGFQGQQRSYISARCSDGVLETHGRFTFADATVIEGVVMKACSVENGP